MIKTVAGIIINDEGKILCTQRDKSKYEYISYKWEFPGGKMEENESEQETLKRELEEELDIEVEIKDKFMQIEHDYPDFHLSMAVYTCKLISKDLKILVHKSIKWLDKEEMLILNWADADIPIAVKIKEEL